MKSVLLLFGGESPEHQVSIISARNVAKAITQEYQLIYGFIDKDGGWWLVDGVVDAKPQSASALLPDFANAAFVADERQLEVDVILPILHGSNGEDGAVQALAQLLHIPFVGCSMTASVVAMQKHISKSIAKSNNIPVVPYLVLRKNETLSYSDAKSKLEASSLFIKPAAAGSSVGITKANNQAEFDEALWLAFQYDDVTLIESSIDARELEVAVLGNPPHVDASVVGEVIPEGEFYSFDSKYSDGSTSRLAIPADISQEISHKIQDMAKKLFISFDGSGMARVDFFLDNKTGDILFNEMNTIPGFTDISMYPKLWEHSGLAYPDLISRLIELAIESYTTR